MEHKLGLFVGCLRPFQRTELLYELNCGTIAPVRQNSEKTMRGE